MGDQVPLDILTNHILLGLSIKCLLRCRCVCKQWRKLISGPEFTAIHIQRQQKQQHCRFLCGPLSRRVNLHDFREDRTQQNPTHEECRGIFYSLDLGSTSPPTLNRLPGFPVNSISDYTLVQSLGYSNGIVCMLAETNMTNERHLFFGNPSTGSYKILQDTIDDGPMIVGFGYDSRVDDYKFVRVDNTKRNARIFSLKSNSWTTNLQSSDKHMIIHRGYSSYTPSLAGSFVGGSIYWLAENKTIVAFNLRDEEFTELPLPGDYKYGQMCSLKVVQSSLCIIKRFQPCSLNYIFQVDMWLLNENNCWMKMMKQAQLIGATDFRPLFFTNDGRILCCVEQSDIMYRSSRLLKYVTIDPQTGRFEDFTICTPENNFFDKFYFPTIYSGHIDSLVSPN